MPTPGTVDTERVSTGDSNNNNVRAPPTTGFFRRALGRISSALNPRQHKTGEDQIERGEHNPRDEGTITRNEEDSSPEGAGINGPLAEATTVQQEQHSPFSSRAFDQLPQPVPIVDVFFGSWWLVLALRTATRPVVIYLSVFWMYNGIGGFVVVLVFLLSLRWVLLKARYDSIPLIGGPIPEQRQLFWTFTRWIQRFWEHVIARVLLKSGGRYTGLRSQLWWFVYLLIAPMAEFRQNYLAAWHQREKLAIQIFVDDENMSIPIPVDGTDEAMLARIRTFYQMMLVGQGFPALVFPKQLQRIDFVEMSKDSLVLGNRLGTLQLGRYRGRLVNMFENPNLGACTVAVAETIRGLKENSALEFQQTYNISAISTVITIPPLASLIFGIAWVQVYAHKDKADLQAIVAAAFTVSSYIVTAGALTLALIAFLDQKRVDNDKMIEKYARRSVQTKAVASTEPDRRNPVPTSSMMGSDHVS